MTEWTIPSCHNPYPEGWTSKSKITSFKYTDPLCLRRNIEAVGSDREVDFIVNEPYTVKYEYQLSNDQKTHCQSLTIPAGLVTDLVTIPGGRVARGLVAALFGIERTGPQLEAAIVHDYLYVAWQCLEPRMACRKHWQFADDLFYAAMKKTGKRKCATWVMYKVSRSECGWRIYEEKNSTIFACEPRFS